MSDGNPTNTDPYSVPPADQPPFQAPPPSSGGKSSTTIIAVILGVALMVFLLCGGVLVALLVPAVSAARMAAQRMQRSNNVKQIGLALHNYHAAYNQLPSTRTINMAGEERLGWRVATSPFAEGQYQWEQYDNTQPWSSPVNESLTVDAPESFQAIDGDPGNTHLFAIVDPQGIFRPTPNTVITFRDIVDGLSNTIMAIELPNRSAIWTSNDNLTPDEAFTAIESLEGNQVAHILMGDGAVRAVGSDFDRELFDAMVTIDGQETVEPPF